MRRTLALTAVALGIVLAVAIPLAGAATVWNTGDIFAGVSNGEYQVYDNAGSFKETISDGQGGFTTGCAFNPDLDKLYTTNFSANNVIVYDDASPHSIAQTINTGAQGGASPESVVFASSGEFYVGHADGNRDIQRYDAAGTYQQSYDVATEGRGSDWVDLAADQKTMFYTSEGRLVKRYDVSGAGAQLADFATLPGPRGPNITYALRLLPPGDGSGGLLVADQSSVKRLDGGGNVIQTYDITGDDGWFSLNLDPDGTSFWAGSFASGKFYRFDIATGGTDNPLDTVDTGKGGFRLFGICLKGEPTAAVPTIIVTGKGLFNTDGNGQVNFTLSNDSVTFDRLRGSRFSFAGDVESVSGSGNTATLKGTGTWNGAGGYTFQVDVVDNGTPGRLKDTIKVVIKDPNGVVVFSQGPEIIKQGDITVTEPT